MAPSKSNKAAKAAKATNAGLVEPVVDTPVDQTPVEQSQVVETPVVEQVEQTPSQVLGGSDAGCGCAGIVASGVVEKKRKASVRKTRAETEADAESVPAEALTEGGATKKVSKKKSSSTLVRPTKKANETPEERAARLKVYKRISRKERNEVVNDPSKKTSTGMTSKDLVSITDKNGKTKTVSRAKFLLSAKFAPWLHCAQQVRKELGITGFATLSKDDPATKEHTDRIKALYAALKGTPEAAAIEKAKREENQAIIDAYDARVNK